jgi:hypothetical protein
MLMQIGGSDGEAEIDARWRLRFSSVTLAIAMPAREAQGLVRGGLGATKPLISVWCGGGGDGVR